MKLDKVFKQFIKNLGFDIKIKKFPYGDLKRRMQLIHHHQIEAILDVGANTGQFGQLMRMAGFKKQLYSFEPLSEAFRKLENKAKKDRLWQAYNLAVGSEDQKSIINISKNSFSSSLLNIMPEHIDATANSRFVDQEEVEVKKLDTMLPQILPSSYDNLYLKIDTQGYSMEVLKGAEKSFPRIKGIQIELAVAQLYENEPIYLEIIEFLKLRNYQLYSLESGFSHKKTGKMLQMEGVFYRESSL
ncbi:MAG: FkbM family methyltransferase [Candidatus Cyclobacteriaceae bacterium M3_2C_046]